MGFVAIAISTSATLLHPDSALAGPSEDLNAYTFPVSKVVGIPGFCRMIQAGSNVEREAECVEWSRKFKENGKPRYDGSSTRSYGSSTRATSNSRIPSQTLSCYTTSGVYSNLGDCR
jgi:hypothetical protein